METQNNNVGTPTVEGVTFSKALALVKEGQKIARAGWNGTGMYVGYSQQGAGPITTPFLFMSTAQGTVVPWLASQTDILANDWVAFNN
jgi:hypothetical protein